MGLDGRGYSKYCKACYAVFGLDKSVYTLHDNIILVGEVSEDHGFDVVVANVVK